MHQETCYVVYKLGGKKSGKGLLVVKKIQMFRKVEEKSKSLSMPDAVSGP